MLLCKYYFLRLSFSDALLDDDDPDAPNGLEWSEVALGEDGPDHMQMCHNAMCFTYVRMYVCTRAQTNSIF